MHSREVPATWKWTFQSVCVHPPVLVVHGFSLLADWAQPSLPPRPGSWHTSPLSQLPAGSQCPYSSAAEPLDSGSSGLCLQSDVAPAPGHSTAVRQTSIAERSHCVVWQKHLFQFRLSCCVWGIYADHINSHTGILHQFLFVVVSEQTKCYAIRIMWNLV